MLRCTELAVSAWKQLSRDWTRFWARRQLIYRWCVFPANFVVIRAIVTVVKRQDQLRKEDFALEAELLQQPNAKTSANSRTQSSIWQWKKHKQLRNTNNNNSSTVKVAYHACFVVVVLGCSECRVSDNPSSILTLSRVMLLYGWEASAESRQKRPHNLQQSHRGVRWRLIERPPSFQITIGQEKNKSFIHGDKTHDLFTSSNRSSINNTQSTAA